MSFLEKATAIRARDSSRLPRRLDSKDVEYGTTPSGERTLVEGILYYLGILRRYTWLILGITFVAAVGVVVFALVSLSLPPEESPLPNYYEATAHLIMNPQGATSTEMILSSLGMEPPEGGAFANTGQIAEMVLTSRETADRLVKKFRIHERYGIPGYQKNEARDVIRAGSSVYYDPRSSSLWIRFQHIDPVLAYDMVQEMIRVLDEWFTETSTSTRTQQRELLETKLAEVTSRIDVLEAEIRQMQSEYNVLSIGELAEAQSQMLSDLRSQKAQKELEIRNYREFSRINDPKMALLQVELQNLTELIDQVERGDYTSLPAQDQIPVLAARFSKLSTELALQQRIFETLSEQYEVVKLSDVDEKPYGILEAPEVPDEKAGPARSELVMMVVAGAFFGSIVLALLIHGIRQISKDPEKLRLLNQSS